MIIEKILEIKILSDTIIGAGKGFGALIDADTELHGGLPWIPAKRVKGILRELAQDLLDVNGPITSGQIVALFGSVEQEATGLWLSNGYLPEEHLIRQFQQIISENQYVPPQCKELCSSQSLSRFYTVSRGQTKIDAITKSAQPGSLRYIRAVKSGTQFYINVQIEDELIKPFSQICKLWRHMGQSRNRGFGNVKVQLKDIEKSPNKITAPVSPKSTHHLRL